MAVWVLLLVILSGSATVFGLVCSVLPDSSSKWLVSRIIDQLKTAGQELFPKAGQRSRLVSDNAGHALVATTVRSTQYAVLCMRADASAFSASSSDDFQGLGSTWMCFYILRSTVRCTESGHPNLWDIHLTHCPGKAPSIVRVFSPSWRRTLGETADLFTAKCKDPPRRWINWTISTGNNSVRS